MTSFAISPWLPWTDRAGRASALKVLCFLACIAPAAWMFAQYELDWLSAKYITDLIRQSGDWTIRFLTMTLAITPLRFLTRWNRLVMIRRMLGLTTLAYGLFHVFLYCVDQAFVWLTILSELVLRTYLTIGLLSVLGLVALGLTSNDRAIRRLGAQRWNRLHRLIYGVALLGIIHFFIQLRLDATEASMMAGFLVLVMGFRLLRRRNLDTRLWAPFALAFAGGLATGLIEAGYYLFSTGVNSMMVLQANLDFTFSVRPAWYVFGTGLCVAFLRLLLALKPWNAVGRLQRARASGQGA